MLCYPRTELLKLKTIQFLQRILATMGLQRSLYFSISNQDNNTASLRALVIITHFNHYFQLKLKPNQCIRCFRNCIKLFSHFYINYPCLRLTMFVLQMLNSLWLSPEPQLPDHSLFVERITLLISTHPWSVNLGKNPDIKKSLI